MSYTHSVLASGLGPTPSAGQFRAIRRLRVVCNVLLIAAHPDDENTRLLSWLVHGQGVRAAYLSLTRGEGGQNLIGPERAPLLGLIRAQELLAARRIDGAEQFFGGQIDFGYSKSREETLEIWNKEQALGEVVDVIRQFRPDVIITRFSPDQRDTHGHHSTSALLAVEAFQAAADPNRFPEQLTQVSPWQATRVVWNWFSLDTDSAPPASAGFLPIAVGDYDPLLGESYPEIAARSLTMHKSQGFGSAGPRGRATDYIQVLAGAPMDRSLFDGIDRSWGRLPGSQPLDALLERIEQEFAVDEPHKSVPSLLEALTVLEAMPDHAWKAHKRQALREAVAACAAIHVSAHVNAGQVQPASTGALDVSVVLRSPLTASVRSVHLRDAGETRARLISAGHPLEHNVPTSIPGEVHWPAAPGGADAEVDVEIGLADRSVVVTRPVVHSWIDPVVGERWEPVTVVPAITVNPQLPVLIVADDKPRVLHLRVRASHSQASGTVRVEVPTGVRIEPAEQGFSLAHAGSEQWLSFTLHDVKSGALRFFVDGADARELIRLDYPHIPPITLTRPTEMRVVRFEMSRGGDRIGYISGAGDEVAQSLRQAGYDVTHLNDEVIESGLIAGFDAIVTGIRAFNTSRRLAALMPRLLSYVEQGGTLVVQYNTNSLFGALTAAIGPYPFTIGEDRVCEENAEMLMRDPEHPVFMRPNQIGASDFTGWVQERGLCFSSRWDSHFTSLLSTHDKGEASKNGALLVATYGSGRLVYTGLAFFRQLPAGVPGAFRLFANLLAK
jgi:LmbE family N-acetylglucosaminyl deacetylase